MLGKIREFTRKLRAGADASIRSEHLLRRILHEVTIANLRSTPRFNDRLRLCSSGYKVYSQNDEDGMIAEVFRRIGTSSRRFVEIGVESGLECNSAFLLLQGWSGSWVEGHAGNASAARSNFSGYPVEVIETYLDAENADAILRRAVPDGQLDLLSIDIDSNDYWVWRAVTTVKPRAVIIEYNATLPPSARKVMAYDPKAVWDGSNYYGASLGALVVLGREKGYSLVGCCLAGANAIFVRDDLVGEKFCAPFTAENHYEPPRYEMAAGTGHRARMGAWVDV